MLEVTIGVAKDSFKVDFMQQLKYLNVCGE